MLSLLISVLCKGQPSATQVGSLTVFSEVFVVCIYIRLSCLSSVSLEK